MVDQREDIDGDDLATDEYEQKTSPTPAPPQDEPRRSIRKRRPFSRYNTNEYMLLTKRTQSPTVML